MPPGTARFLRRAATLGLLLAAALLSWTNVARPLLAALDGSRVRLAEAEDEVARLRSSLLSLKQARGPAGGDPAGGGAGGGEQLWAGDAEPVVAARIQEAVQGIAAAAGVSLASVTYLEAGEIEGTRLAQFRLDAAGDYPSLVSFLLRVERSRPFLFVTAAAVWPRAPAAYRDAAGQAGGQAVEARLDIGAPFALRPAAGGEGAR